MRYVLFRVFCNLRLAHLYKACISPNITQFYEVKFVKIPKSFIAFKGFHENLLDWKTVDTF